MLESSQVGQAVQWCVTDTMCPVLTQYGIRSVGITELRPGYSVFRLNPPFSLINVCLRGTGNYFVNGRWRKVPAGWALLRPRHYAHGTKWNGSALWKMAWIVFADETRKFPRVARTETEIVRTNVATWECALRGLHEEMQGENNPGCTRAWAEVIHQLVRHVVGEDDRLARLAVVWERVAAELEHPWTAAELAKLAGMSEVHLRRLCTGTLGRSPMQQVAWLRIQRASLLLQGTRHTVESVAWMVGYASTSAFRSAYCHWLGKAPQRSRRLA